MFILNDWIQTSGWFSFKLSIIERYVNIFIECKYVKVTTIVLTYLDLRINKAHTLYDLYIDCS